jgi:hypothetical protein
MRTVNQGGLAARFWASKKIEELELFPDIPENKTLATELGRKYK